MMKKKTGILILLLGVPVFLFIWGKYSLTHHFTLPTYYSQNIDANGDTVYHKTLPFNLLNFDKEVVDESIVDQKYYIAGFFTASCTNDCMKMISQMVKVQESFSNLGDFKILLFTPDSHDVIGEIYDDYNFGEQVVILSGTDSVIANLAQNSYFINVLDQDKSYFENKLVLVDKKKEIRGFYLGTDNSQIDRMLTEVRLLDKIYNER